MQKFPDDGRSYILAKVTGEPDDDNLTLPAWLEYFVREDGKTTLEYREALLFSCRQCFLSAIPAWHRREGYSAIVLDRKTTNTVLRYRLAKGAKERFGLKGNTPYCVVADRYKEEGMLEEAELLRMRLR